MGKKITNIEQRKKIFKEFEERVEFSGHGRSKYKNKKDFLKNTKYKSERFVRNELKKIERQTRIRKDYERIVQTGLDGNEAKGIASSKKRLENFEMIYKDYNSYKIAAAASSTKNVSREELSKALTALNPTKNGLEELSELPFKTPEEWSDNSRRGGKKLLEHNIVAMKINKEMGLDEYAKVGFTFVYNASVEGQSIDSLKDVYESGGNSLFFDEASIYLELVSDFI